MFSTNITICYFVNLQINYFKTFADLRKSLMPIDMSLQMNLNILYKRIIYIYILINYLHNIIFRQKRV